MAFDRDFVDLVRDERWEEIVSRLLKELSTHFEWDAGWRLLGRAIRELGDELPESFDHPLLEIVGEPCGEYDVDDLALAAYTRAWVLSGKADEISAAARISLRKGRYHYEDWCWNCHEYVSDAPFDNAGQCTHSGFRCYKCRHCGSARHEAPFRRA